MIEAQERHEKSPKKMTSTHARCGFSGRILISISISIYLVPRFVARAVSLAQQRRVGGQWEEGVVQGPQISRRQFDRVSPE